MTLVPNPPENIIFCIDQHAELAAAFEHIKGNSTKANATNTTNNNNGSVPVHSRMDTIKECVKCVATLKRQLNPSTRFALVTIHDTSAWVLDFTQSVDDLMAVVDQLAPIQGEPCNKFDTAQLVELLATQIASKTSPGMTVNPDTAAYRAIVYYGRSNQRPDKPNTSNWSPSASVLTQAKWFYLDLHYIHAKVGPDNQCQSIFDDLIDFEDMFHNGSYIYESSGPRKLRRQCCILAAHPRQRPNRQESYRTQFWQPAPGQPANQATTTTTASPAQSSAPLATGQTAGTGQTQAAVLQPITERETGAQQGSQISGQAGDGEDRTPSPAPPP